MAESNCIPNHYWVNKKLWKCKKHLDYCTFQVDYRLKFERACLQNRIMPKQNTSIPNITIGEDYDKKFAHAPIHYDSLANLASFFGRNMRVHRHPQYWQIHFIEGGRTRFHIDDREYNIDGPCCFVTPAAIPHSFQVSDETCGHVITIHQALVWEFAKDNITDSFRFGGSTGFCIEINNGGAAQKHDWRLLEQTLTNIKHEWQRDSQSKATMINGLTQILLVTLLRLSPTINHGSIVDDEELRIFRKFSDVIEANFTKRWNLQSYTEALGVSENRLNQICHHICSNSPKRLINERILQEARHLLTHTSSSCNEISYELGFSDPSYFSRFFKTQTGKTAQEYRKNISEHAA